MVRAAALASSGQHGPALNRRVMCWVMGKPGVAG